LLFAFSHCKMEWLFGRFQNTESGKSARKWKQKQQALSMDSGSRRALQTAVAEETTAIASDLEDVQIELEVALSKFKEAQEREQFLCMRIKKYEKLLSKEAQGIALASAAVAKRKISESANNHDEETSIQSDEEQGVMVTEGTLEKREEKWRRDKELLIKVKEAHKQILVTCEEMRRNVCKLKQRQSEITDLTDECDDFLTIAERERRNEQQLDPQIDLVRIGNETSSSDYGVQTPTTS